MQEAFSLEVCRKRSEHIWLDLDFKVIGPPGSPIFGSVLTTSLFSNLIFFLLAFAEQTPFAILYGLQEALPPATRNWLKLNLHHQSEQGDLQMLEQV